ncbi:MAG TPA: hypothetical protein VFX65_01510 [Candidatus Limnocylindrales bacterium]|nr:hypothetical protein [Candidatus Limnocylindrales bacterium]
MSKSTITRLFGIAVTTVVAGITIGIAGIAVALANGAISFGGPQLITVNGGPLAGAVAALVVASLAIAAGTVAVFASWLGALWNTWRLDDRTWFVALLVLGLGSLGWVAMFAYLLKGPDSTAHAAAVLGHVAPAGADRS